MGEGEKMKIASVGHISLDITPGFNNSKDQTLQKLLVPGKLVDVHGLEFTLGGSVSNSGLAMDKLGAEVYLMSKVGNDVLGNILIDKLENFSCHNMIRVSENENTSYTIVLAPKGSDRVFIHDAGCNATFGINDIDMDVLKKLDHIHFGYPPLMKNMYANDCEELVELMKKAKKFGLTTSLDLAMIDPFSETAKLDWKKMLKRVLPYIDFFVPSIEELGFMINRPQYDKWQKISGNDDVTKHISLSEDVIPLADEAIKMGAKIVLLKCGIAGMYLRTSSENVMNINLPKLKKWGGISMFEDSFVPDRVLSGTGAGDTSIAAFLISALSGKSPKEALQYAAGTGASCVTEYDTISGLLSFDELRNKIDSGWKKQHIIQE